MAAAGDAEEAPPTAAQRAPRASDGRPAHRGDVGTFFLADGRHVDGTLVSSSDLGQIIQLASGGRLFLPPRSVVAVVAAGAPTPWAGLEGEAARVFLRDGRIFDGRIVSRTPDALVLDVVGPGQLRFAADDVREAFGTGGEPIRLHGSVDVAASRAIWSATAFTARPGELTLSSSQLLQTSMTLGLPYGIAVSTSSTAPIWFASDVGWNGSVSARLGRQILRLLHASGGAAVFVSERGTLVSAFGMAAVGSRDRFLSVYAGPPPPSADALGRFGDRVFTASAGWRLARRVSLLAEGWLGPPSLGSESLGAAAVRLLGRRVNVDLGAAVTPARGIVPFLGLEVTLRRP